MVNVDAGEKGAFGEEGIKVRQLKILLVEDQIGLAPLIKIKLKSHKVIDFDNAEQALEAFTESQELDEPFDCVITDYNLAGEMNGIDLATKIKKAQRKGTFVVLYTGSAKDIKRKYSKEQLLEMGIHYVTEKGPKVPDFKEEIQLAREYHERVQGPQIQLT